MAVPAIADDVMAKPISDASNISFMGLGMDGEVFDDRAERQGREKI
jgi:hypothetical protein